MELLRIAHPDRPALDMAFTGALVHDVAEGSVAESIRLLRPGPTLAFGRLDRLRPGFPQACRVAAAHGRAPVIRWGGGRAAAYDRECVLVEIVRRQRGVIGGLEERFADLTAFVREALSRLGVALEVGERPGEYCPGRFSLHLPDGPKVAGVAQRVTRGASLTTAAIVVGGGPGLRDVIGAVYASLELPVDVAAAAALDEAHLDLTAEAVLKALAERAGERYQTRPTAPSAALLPRALQIVPAVEATSRQAGS